VLTHPVPLSCSLDGKRIYITNSLLCPWGESPGQQLPQQPPKFAASASMGCCWAHRLAHKLWASGTPACPACLTASTGVGTHAGPPGPQVMGQRDVCMPCLPHCPCWSVDACRSACW